MENYEFQDVRKSQNLKNEIGFIDAIMNNLSQNEESFKNIFVMKNSLQNRIDKQSSILISQIEKKDELVKEFQKKKSKKIKNF